MTGLVAQLRRGAGGVYALMAFRPDWRSYFDVSFNGMTASFTAAIVSLPAFILTVAASNHFIAATPELADAGASIGLWGAIGQYARIWLVFPVVAFAVVWVMGLKTGLAAWITVHNWAVAALLHIQALIWALYAAGIFDVNALSAMLGFYQVLRLAVHWRVAAGAMGLHWSISAGAACIPLVVDAILVYGVFAAVGG